MPRKKNQGFTLIELMITVAIIAILAAVAYPSYTSYLAKGRRAAAQSFMQNLLAKQEQHMLNARSYFTVATGAASEWSAVKITVPHDVDSHYTVTVTAIPGSPPGFSIKATPKNPSADTACGYLTLDNTGAKGQETGSLSKCW